MPTFFIVLLLHFYLKQTFFKPLSRVLAERDEATAGARRKAAEALDRASAQTAAYEEKIRAARNEIYREQEEVRRQWRDEQLSQIATARKSADQAIATARADLQAQANDVRQALASETQSLADRITRSVLEGRTA
ncbi:MAG TPA: hypothetical protein VES20_23540 [Bryobacteraceae bacterium]|nr:hypothetical protein [Bryobacteraceae bacterium]